MTDFEDQARVESEILTQAARVIGEPLLEELEDADLTEVDCERIVAALGRAVETGWRLGAQAAVTQLET